ncbi:MAG: DMT family transporter [Alphaproteobacteria bacterium]|nr:DMT family transporter [Alphaproteobacteria bacterium]
MTAQTDARPLGHNLARGIPAIIGAVFLFSFADALAKWFGQAGYDSVQIVFFRYAFGLIPVTIAIVVSGVGGLKTKRPFAHFLRGLFMFAALTLFFRGLKTLPLAEGIAVAFSAPLFVTALSWPMLGERVGPYRWAAVIIGFAGALVVLRPGTDAFKPEALFIVASAVFFALAMLHTRRISRTETNVAMYTYSTVIAGSATVPLLPFVWVAPQPVHLWLFLAVGLIGGAASYLMIVAYRNSPAAVNASFDYSALIWGALLGWIFWNEKPDVMVWVGAAIIVAAGMTITYRESRSGIKTPRRGR